MYQLWNRGRCCWMEIQTSYGSMLEKAGFSCGFRLLLTVWTLIFRAERAQTKVLELMENLPLIFTGFGYWFVWVGVEHIMATQNFLVLLKFFAFPSHYVKSNFLRTISFFVRMFFCSVESGGVFVHSLICYSINFVIWSFPIMSGWHGRFWKKWKCFCWRLLTLKTGFFRYFSKSFQGVVGHLKS